MNAADSTAATNCLRLARRAALFALLACQCWSAATAMAEDPGGSALADGAAITPAFAEAMFKQVAPLREADGCRLTRFDTGRFRITIGLSTPSGTERTFELAASRSADAPRRVGDWSLAVPSELANECGSTLTAIEHVLETTTAPKTNWNVREFPNILVLLVTLVLLALGTARVLWREARTQRPPAGWLLALIIVGGLALWLRLEVSPRTFLHEYYHIAETIVGYLSGSPSPTYGKTGPALYRLVAWLLQRPDDVQIIFLTNAVMATLAVPAVALLDLALIGSWPHALCAALLLAVLPHHLRFAAAEDLFIPAITLSFWSLGLLALYTRTRRLGDGLLAALAISLTMQARPEMIFFPLVLLGMIWALGPGTWRVLLQPASIAAAALLALLLTPRLIELHGAAQMGAPTSAFPNVFRWAGNLVLFQPHVTPVLFQLMLIIGLGWGLRRALRPTLWVLFVYAGYTLFSASIYDNPPYHLRTQLLPTVFVVMIAAGVAPLWLSLWAAPRRGLHLGATALAAVSVLMLVGSHHFVTELRDQQLEWLFLERSVPQLPPKGRLLTAVEQGGHNLDAFPDLLLKRANRNFDTIDVRQVGRGERAWPDAGDDLIYYQGMFCYFAFSDEPLPDPMTAACRAVHDRYITEPLFVEDLATQGYSALTYAKSPYRIGFYRLHRRP